MIPWILVTCCLATSSMAVTTPHPEYDPDEDPHSVNACYQYNQRDPTADFDLSSLVDVPEKQVEKWIKQTMDESLEKYKKLHELTIPYAPRRAMKAEKRGTFSWEPDCPSTKRWLETYQFKSNLSLCFVFVPDNQRIAYVQCNSARCTRTCAEDSAGSKCLQSNFVEYGVWLFCPNYLQPKRPKRRRRHPCQRKPNRCIFKETVLVPQSCDCYTCRSKALIDALNVEANSANGQ